MSLTGAKLQSLDRFRTVEGPVDVLLATDLVALGLDIQESLGSNPWPQGYRTFFMLSSAESKIYSAHKC